MGKLKRPSGAKLFRVGGNPFPFRAGARVWIHHADGTDVPLVTDGERLSYVRTARLSAVVPLSERLARWLRERRAVWAWRRLPIAVDEFSGDSSSESL